MNQDILHYTLRLFIALVVGGLIGVEREIKGKPAGMRTNMLMCMGSCLLMILSIEVARRSGHASDPGRIAAQVVTGIGFLGAGTILRSRVSVTGLTSAATLWFVAAIGLVIGAGIYLLAGVAALLIIITLNIIGRLEVRMGVRQRLHILKFKLTATHQAMKSVKNAFQAHRINPEDISLEREQKAILFDIEYAAADAKHQALLGMIKKIEGVEIIIEY